MTKNSKSGDSADERPLVLRPWFGFLLIGVTFFGTMGFLHFTGPEAIRPTRGTEVNRAIVAHIASGLWHRRGGRLALADAHFHVSHRFQGVTPQDDDKAIDRHYARLAKSASACLASGDELGAFHAFQEVFDAGAVVQGAKHPPLARSELVPVFTQLLEIARRDHGREQQAGHPSWPELRELAHAMTGQHLGPEPPK